MENVTGQLVLDGDIAKVTEFIEKEVGPDRRVYVAERLAEVARVIWADTHCAILQTGVIRETPLNASGCAPVPLCVGDDSGAAMGGD